MNVVYQNGDKDLAMVYVGELPDGSMIEFVESLQPPIPRAKKWVLIISTLKGCPVNCPMCDAGGSYTGRLGTEELFAQLDYLILRRYPDGHVPVEKLKVQFARMGDPAFNSAVLDLLDAFPDRYDAPGFLPSISTIAPKNAAPWLERLRTIKESRYGHGRFQMQFSLHTTCFEARRKLVPVETLTFEEMARFGERFFAPGDQKITLNFAAVKGFPLEPAKLATIFDPERFIIKLTPVNPTSRSAQHGLTGVIDPASPGVNNAVVERFMAEGYQVILSIGELRENQIGSNCGMYVDHLSAPHVSTREQQVTSAAHSLPC